MYWIYLVIFIMIVFVPGIINHDYLFLKEAQVEELLIFILGSIGFLIFIFKEKKLSKIIREKLQAQKKANIMSKDLMSSYTYIGEMNRKIEILNNIFNKITDLRYSQLSNNGVRKTKKETEKMIVHAIRIFLGKNQRFCLSTINLSTKKKEKDFQRCRSFKMNFSINEIIHNYQNQKEIDFENVYKKSKQIIIFSNQEIRNKIIFLVLQLYSNKRIDNLNIVQLLLTQLLFVSSLDER